MLIHEYIYMTVRQEITKKINNFCIYIDTMTYEDGTPINELPHIKKEFMNYNLLLAAD